MINLRHNYPLLEQQSEIFSQYLRQASQSYALADHALPPWGGAPQDKAIAAAWLALDPAAQTLSISISGNHALLNLILGLQLTGKTIVTESFTYGAFKALAAMLGIELLACATDQDGICTDALAKLCEQHEVAAIYLQPTLQNPACFTMPTPRRHHIAQLARSFDFIIIEDDAYRFLHPHAPVRFMDLLPNQTCHISSLTKPFSPALKLAYLVCPLRFQSAIDNAIRVSSSGVSPLLTRIASAMLQDKVIDQIVQAKRDDASMRQQLVSTILGQTRRDSAPSSYHVWLHLPPHLHADQLRANLFDQGIDLSSGTEFAAPGVDGSGYIRFCIGAERDPKQLSQGLRQLHLALQTYPQTTNTLEMHMTEK